MPTEEEIRAENAAWLVKIADQMESAEPGTAFYNELKRDYRRAMKGAGIGVNKNEHALKPSEVNKSRKEALAKIKELLDVPDIDAQFKERNGDYYSKDKFIVSWGGNWNGIPSEFSLDLVDSFYSGYSGAACIYATRSLVHEKQLGSYANIECGLINIGLKLCKGRADKKEFYDKYAVPYNNRLKKNKDGNEKNGQRR